MNDFYRKTTGYLVICLVTLAGCTSMNSVELSTQRLHQEIRSGAAVQIKDYVEVVTEEGEVLSFTVTGLPGDAVVGKGVEVPVDSIASLKVRAFDGGKTAGATAGAGVVVLSMFGALFLFLLAAW